MSSRYRRRSIAVQLSTTHTHKYLPYFDALVNLAVGTACVLEHPVSSGYALQLSSVRSVVPSRKVVGSFVCCSSCACCTGRSTSSRYRTITTSLFNSDKSLLTNHFLKTYLRYSLTVVRTRSLHKDWLPLHRARAFEPALSPEAPAWMALPSGVCSHRSARDSNTFRLVLAFCFCRSASGSSTMRAR